MPCNEPDTLQYFLEAPSTQLCHEAFEDNCHTVPYGLNTGVGDNPIDQVDS